MEVGPFSYRSQIRFPNPLCSYTRPIMKRKVNLILGRWVSFLDKRLQVLQLLPSVCLRYIDIYVIFCLVEQCRLPLDSRLQIYQPLYWLFLFFFTPPSLLQPRLIENVSGVLIVEEEKQTRWWKIGKGPHWRGEIMDTAAKAHGAFPFFFSFSSPAPIRSAEEPIRGTLSYWQ